MKKKPKGIIINPFGQQSGKLLIPSKRLVVPDKRIVGPGGKPITHGAGIIIPSKPKKKK